MKKLLVILCLLMAAGCSAGNQQHKAVAFGDSNTRGANFPIRDYPENEKWVNLLNLSKKGEAKIYNAGIAGETTEDARKRFKKDVLKRKPEVVFIMFGTNDAVILQNGKPRVSKKRFENNLLYFINEIKKIGGRPVLITCLPIVEGNGTDKLYYSRYEKIYYDAGKGARNWHNSYNDIVRKTAGREHLPLIDHWRNMVRTAGGDTDSDLIASGLIDPSGNHMTPKGSRLLYEAIIESGVLAE
ncbi:SGNH/GDSL hydrolase family protein [Bacillus sp. FJAT-42376]|uniref:SGNH/GDSL hydrolase family protein n=1 Tax=Bacillus sp. FJAT-42376 TaxID=2014076 RepID=UPI000F4EC03B|nr:SGNH/GDSL hydrolase family protein [Bacillus sp. FJAT-42376]AZB43703.1 SGNH/GDSL hydrolase family protein [Bacillus sp. FJAT-42376]